MDLLERPSDYMRLKNRLNYENEWLNGGHPQVILGNLYAGGKIEPMIVR